MRSKRSIPRGTKRRTPIVQMTLPADLIDEIDRFAETESGRRFGERVTRSRAVRELCTLALRAIRDGTGQSPARRAYDERMAATLRVFRLGEEPPLDTYTAKLSPDDRVKLIGELTLNAYAMRGEDIVPRIRRDVGCIVRRGSRVPRHRRLRGRGAR